VTLKIEEKTALCCTIDAENSEVVGGCLHARVCRFFRH